MRKFIIFFLFLFVFILIGCDSSTSYKKDHGLYSVKNAEELRDLLEASKEKYDSNRIGGPETDDSVDEDEQSNNDYTKTNVQVEGVDEGDIIKTDGKRIYAIKNDRLKVIEILPNGKMELVLYEQIKSNNNETNLNNTYFYELYLTNKYLVVIGQKYQYDYYMDDKSIYIGEPEISYPTFLSIITIYNLNTLNKVDEYQISGNIITSRLIDNNLYLLSNHYNYMNNDDVDPRPYIIHDNSIQYVNYDDIKYLPNTIHQTFTVISKLNLEYKPKFDSDIFLGSSSWGQIYVSKRAIYLASSYYEETKTGNYVCKGKLISYQFDEEGTVTYGGSGDYLGYVINQFAMDEYNGNMRIVTTEGWGDNVKNRLYVFERKLVDEKYVLEVIGSINEGLGNPRETIQSVRFNQDKATVVTYEQTDPLYTIDLSNPEKPTIKGELKVPGFSTYLHPWTDDLVVGIGFDSIGNITNGLKLSLYDISDFETPMEVGSPLKLTNNSNSWSYSEALWNHKALLIDKAKSFIGFSLWRSNWNEYNYSSMNDYIVFDVDDKRSQPIQIKYTINHIDYYTKNKELFTSSWYYSFTIDRAVRIGDYLYVISGEVVTSHNLLSDANTTDVIIFEEK